MNKQQLAAKNYLMRAFRIDNRINSKLDQIASLNDLATRATLILVICLEVLIVISISWKMRL